MPNRTQPFCYINTFTPLWLLNTNYSQNQQNTTNPSSLQSSKFKLFFSMGRQSSDPTMVTSSIALLQERFRQLQKVKERREEQQLLKMLSETATLPMRPSTTTPADNSLSLGLNLQTKQVDYFSIKTQPSTNPWPNNTAAATASASKSFDSSSDLDTSLHL